MKKAEKNLKEGKDETTGWFSMLWNIVQLKGGLQWEGNQVDPEKMSFLLSNLFFK